jgi:hypothetical protein
MSLPVIKQSPRTVFELSIRLVIIKLNRIVDHCLACVGTLSSTASMMPWTFSWENAPYAAGQQNFTYILINGGLDTQQDTVDNDVEANLDIQYAASLGYKDTLKYYSTGGPPALIVPDLDELEVADDQNEPYIDFLNYILKVPNDELPQTITTS